MEKKKEEVSAPDSKEKSQKSRKKKDVKKEVVKEGSLRSPSFAKANEEVSEIFKLEKDGKEKIIETHNLEKTEEKPVSEEQIKKENKLFKNLIIVMIGFGLMFFAVYMIMNSMRHFEVEGVKFEIVKQGQLTLYKTYLPVMYNGSAASYNFYLRTDPRTLKSSVPFNGNLMMESNMVVNMTDSLNCDGDGIIGLANIVNLYGVLGTNVIKDENASCDSAGRYMYLNIREGNQTKVQEYGLRCYNIYVNNCEVLKGTEKFMLESFIRANKALEK